MTRTSGAIIGAFAMLIATRSAEAQTTAPPGRVEIGGGILWIGGQSMGTRNATETASAGSPLTLFTAASTLDAAPPAGFHGAGRATRATEMERSATSGRPTVRVA